MTVETPIAEIAPSHERIQEIERLTNIGTMTLAMDLARFVASGLLSSEEIRSIPPRTLNEIRNRLYIDDGGNLLSQTHKPNPRGTLDTILGKTHPDTQAISDQEEILQKGRELLERVNQIIVENRIAGPYNMPHIEGLIVSGSYILPNRTPRIDSDVDIITLVQGPGTLPTQSESPLIQTMQNVARNLRLPILDIKVQSLDKLARELAYIRSQEELVAAPFHTNNTGLLSGQRYSVYFDHHSRVVTTNQDLEHTFSEAIGFVPGLHPEISTDCFEHTETRLPTPKEWAHTNIVINPSIIAMYALIALKQSSIQYPDNILFGLRHDSRRAEKLLKI